MTNNGFRRLPKGISIGLLALLLIGAEVPSPLGRSIASPSTREQEKVGAQPSRTEQDEEREALERERQQAIQLLRQAHDLAQDIPDPVVRIRSYAAIAEALWEQDQPLARQLFRAAFEETHRVPVPERPKGARAWIGSTRAPDELRREILAKVSKLDPTLATELAKSLEVEKSETGEPKREEDPEVRRMRQATGSERARALIDLANLWLEKDPRNAAEAAAAALSEGVTQPFVMFLMRLRSKDAALADQLFAQALRTTTRNTPALLYELIPLGSYVAQDWRLPMRFSAGSEPPPVNPINAARYLSILTEALAQHVQIALNPMLAPGLAQTDWFTNPRDLYHLLTVIRPHVQQYLPDRTALVDGLLNQLALKLPAREQTEVETTEAKRALSPEERLADLLRQAERTKDAEERDALLFQAISAAISANNFETAADLLPRLSDLALRAEVSDYVHYRWAEHALAGGEIETARRSALELRNPERLAYVFGRIAQKLEAQKERDAALAMLQEAEARIRRLPASIEKARALVLIAEAFLPLEADRAFEAFAQAIGPLNQPDALTERLGVSFQFNVRNMGLVIGVTERDIARMFERVIAALTTADPARTLLLLSGLENPSLRLIAQIAYARRHLELLKEKLAKLAKRRSE
ncbi:MAG: hypothetical protein N2443_08225 [Blastocatellia bacterium]|nr:hypothetical protein [Blastocatellia bacterium]MCX7752840.1 hypothetical protein [Blastocatellia bacterium]MDW8257255.1 hypothetical protein [Acidobacteriota bacterium]